jgi:2,4-dienoyl-CoA reductase (NADPH2)
VELWERVPHLGGQLRAASRDVGGGEVFLRLIDYYERQLARVGVTVRLATEANGKAVTAFRPDVCILATGAKVAVDPVAASAPAGIAVWLGDSVDDPPEGDRVVVLGVDRAALVAAEVLAKAGRDVTMLPGGKRPSWDVAPTFKWRHAAWVKEFGIRVLSGASAAGWDEAGRLRLQWAGEPTAGQERPDALDVDLLVAAGERESRQRLIHECEYRADVLHTVGDAVSPQSVWQAVHSAYRVAAHV